MFSRLFILFTFIATWGTAQQPQPRPVSPAPVPGGPPSDAVVLFDGRNLAEWMHRDSQPLKWTLQDGAMVCNTGSGHAFTRRKLGSAQLHVEFSIPLMPEAKDQARGNSGVYLQGRYEIQVLDSYQNPTYPDGACAALYRQYAPLVNASLPPERWQTYDIVFHAPKCEQGTVIAPGTLTLFHNGVLVHDHVTVKGPTSGAIDKNVCDPGPLMLQDHYHPAVKETFMKFRNIWYRPLE